VWPKINFKKANALESTVSPTITDLYQPLFSGLHTNKKRLP